MSNSREAARESFRRVNETCPEVDHALNQASEIIKEQTGMLREALVAAIEERMEADDRISELEYDVRSMQDMIERLEEHNAVLETENSILQDKIWNTLAENLAQHEESQCLMIQIRDLEDEINNLRTI